MVKTRDGEQELLDDYNDESFLDNPSQSIPQSVPQPETIDQIRKRRIAEARAQLANFSPSTSSTPSQLTIAAPTQVGTTPFQLYPRQKSYAKKSALHTLPGVETVITDWPSFQNYLDEGQARLIRAKEEDTRLRNEGERVAPGGLGFYDTTATKKLADLVGRSNVGVRYRPYLGAAASAREWLATQQNKAKTDKEKEAWGRWGIQEADLDDNLATPDNVITFSDTKHGKIKAIDGYELMPRATKEVSRSFYSTFPKPEDRQRIDDKTRRQLRAWYRKYPTPDEQISHPFDKFTPELSPYQIIRDAVMALLEGFNIKIKSKNNSDGIISAKHYMSLVQKLTGILHSFALLKIYNLSNDYDFKTDPQGIKTKRVRKHTTKILLNIEGNGKSYIDNLLNNKILQNIFIEC
jgi:hypothetical protein